MAYRDELESTVRRLWSAAYAVTPTEVAITRHGDSPGIVVRAPGLDSYHPTLDDVLKRCALVALLELRSGKPDHCRAQELILCAYECNRLLDPAGEHQLAPPGAERAA